MLRRWPALVIQRHPLSAAQNHPTTVGHIQYERDALMMPAVVTVTEAVRVLNQTTHRGVRDWRYDHQLQRVMPSEWGNIDVPPAFTPFEVVTIARRLVEIGAVRP